MILYTYTYFYLKQSLCIKVGNKFLRDKEAGTVQTDLL